MFVKSTICCVIKKSSKTTDLYYNIINITCNYVRHTQTYWLLFRYGIGMVLLYKHLSIDFNLIFFFYHTQTRVLKIKMYYWICLKYWCSPRVIYIKFICVPSLDFWGIHVYANVHAHTQILKTYDRNRWRRISLAQSNSSVSVYDRPEDAWSGRYK